MNKSIAFLEEAKESVLARVGVRVLLDECVPARLRQSLPSTLSPPFPRMGWAGVKNGRLLALAEAEFDVLLTVDRNLSSQQQLAKFQLAFSSFALAAIVSRIFARSFLDLECAKST